MDDGGMMHHCRGSMDQRSGVDGEGHGGDDSSGGDGQDGGQNYLQVIRKTLTTVVSMISEFGLLWMCFIS